MMRDKIEELRPGIAAILPWIKTKRLCTKEQWTALVKYGEPAEVELGGSTFRLHRIAGGTWDGRFCAVKL